MIDAFNHFSPRAFFDSCRDAAPKHPMWRHFDALPALWDVDARLALLDNFPGLRQVLCPGNPQVDVLGSADAASDLARLANEELARTCAAHPDRFPAFLATVPMTDIKAAVAELEHAVTALGARGVQLYTNVLGRSLSEPEFRPVFETAERLDVPVFVHPMRGADMADYQAEAHSHDEIWFTFGWPYETAACMTRLIYSGLLDACPGLKLVTHHIGGIIPFLAGKIRLGVEQVVAGDEDRNPAAVRAGLTGPPIDYYKRLYADTALNGDVGALRCGRDFFGTGHLLFGTDAPFSPRHGASIIANTIRSVQELDLTPAERHQIFEGNVSALLRIGADAATTATKEGK